MSAIMITPKNLLLHVNDRVIDQFGTGTPLQKNVVDPKRGLLVGMGGHLAVTLTAGQKIQCTLAVMQHSPDSNYLFNLYKTEKSNAVSFEYRVLGTSEHVLSKTAIMTSLGDISRGNTEPSDDIFMFEFVAEEQDLGNNEIQWNKGSNQIIRKIMGSGVDIVSPATTV